MIDFRRTNPEDFKEIPDWGEQLIENVNRLGESSRNSVERLRPGGSQYPVEYITQDLTTPADYNVTGNEFRLAWVDFTDHTEFTLGGQTGNGGVCLLYTSPSPRD